MPLLQKKCQNFDVTFAMGRDQDDVANLGVVVTGPPCDVEDGPGTSHRVRPAGSDALDGVTRLPSHLDQLLVVDWELRLVPPAGQPVLAVAVEGQIYADTVLVLLDSLAHGLGLRLGVTLGPFVSF